MQPCFVFPGKVDYFLYQFVHPNGRLGGFVKITEGFSVAVDSFNGFDELVVVVGYHAELGVEPGQSCVVVQRRFIDGDDLEGSSEDNAVDELGFAFHARTFVHGKEPFVFLVGQVKEIAVLTGIG